MAYDPEDAEEDEVPTCHSCGFENPVGGLKSYRRSGLAGARGEEWLICEICAGSMISNSQDYSHYENPMLYRSLGYCTNAILKAIRRTADGHRDD